MAIFSLCCDLETRVECWAPRIAGTDRPHTEQTPVGITAVEIAGRSAKLYATDLKGRSVDWG